MKTRLPIVPVLGHPDPSKTYILDTNAINVEVGAVLSQIQDKEKRLIVYYSKTLAQLEKNCCVTRKELLQRQRQSSISNHNFGCQ